MKKKWIVLVIGSGAREHALGKKIADSPLVSEVLFAPGNAGTTEIGTNFNIKADNIEGLLMLAREMNVDLTVVGPEDPLAAGIVDRFEAEGFKIFGPSKAAAQLESSKFFCKSVLNELQIPTAEHFAFDDIISIRRYLKRLRDWWEGGSPIVVKADGLWAGKGVFICRNEAEILAAAEKIIAKGEVVLLERFLSGEEASYIAMCDGTNFVPLATSQDHKKLWNGDQGPNTGGMGAYSPAPVITSEIEKKVKDYIRRLLCYFKAQQTPYRGFIYLGLMIVDGEPYLLEINVRMGDPECCPIIMRMGSDIVPRLIACTEGKLLRDLLHIEWDPRPAITVVKCAHGYGQGDVRKGDHITGLDSEFEPEAMIFHAGTAKNGHGQIVTNGGRVLDITALGETFQDAAVKAYRTAAGIKWADAHFRSDIGRRVLGGKEDYSIYLL